MQVRENGRMLQRNLLYTAVSRASELAVMVSSEEVNNNPLPPHTMTAKSPLLTPLTPPQTTISATTISTIAG